MRLLEFLLIALVGVSPVFSQTYGAYFVNWAQYRTSPYTYTADSLKSIIGRIDELYYGFVYFCPPAGTNPLPYWAVAPYGNCTNQTEYQLMFVETKDSQFLSTINSYKATNPKLKVYLSIGGWNFPSEYFSKLAASSDARTKFSNSALSFLKQYNCDGIDLDWEYPCSPPRTNPVEISCTEFRTVDDAGGKCPDDATNIVSLVKDVKGALGTKYLLTFASQAAKANELNMNLSVASNYVDKWHIMSYDYTVSDLDDPSAAVMSPNAPLNPPPPPALNMSISQTYADYLSLGVPKSKIMIGIPLYGHTWFQPSLVGTDSWKKFGNSGKIQGECCGVFAQTYGAKYGKGSNMCGTLMYSEILNAAPQTYYDSQTQSAIGFWNTQGSDGWTEAGTWVSYNDKTSVTAITQWALSQGMDGVFIFDTSEDSVTSSGTFTYELMNAIADTLGNHGNNTSGNQCNPSVGCNVCSACCSSVYNTQAACDSCVSSNCNTDPCAGKSAGQYCVSKSTFVNCPSDITQNCGAGTCCQQQGTSIICGFC